MITAIILTLNSSEFLKKLFKSISVQTVKPDEVIVVDSSSEDDTVDVAKGFGARVIVIDREDFNHGETRTLAGKEAKGDVLIYMTHDVILADENAFENLVKPFSFDDKVGATFGRQLPHQNATVFARALRYYNYPDKSYTITLEDVKKLGIQSAFVSDSFAAYRKSALEDVGWFGRTHTAEDRLVAAKLLLKGYKIFYVADARCYHSHNYRWYQELKRYFDVVSALKMHDEFKRLGAGKIKGGLGYVKYEMSLIIRDRKFHLLPVSFFRNFAKFVGSKLGWNYKHLPLWLIKRLSCYPRWWKKYKCDSGVSGGKE